MRYVLKKNGEEIGRGSDVMGVINANWPQIKNDWKDGFTLHDNYPTGPFRVWSCCYVRSLGGVEISPIGV